VVALRGRTSRRIDMPYSPAKVDFSKLSSEYKTLWTADAKTRAKLLSTALQRSQTDFETILLLYLVQDFAAAPTKTKFFLIHDAYFTDQVTQVRKAMEKKGLDIPPLSKRTPTKLPCPLDVNYMFTYTELARLLEMAEVVDFLSDIAKNKNFLDRYLTSSSRKIPGDIFNDLVGELMGLRAKKDELADELKLNLKTEAAFEDLASILSGQLSQKDSNASKNLKTIQGALKDALKKAGFDTKKAGIEDMKL